MITSDSSKLRGLRRQIGPKNFDEQKALRNFLFTGLNKKHEIYST